MKKSLLLFTATLTVLLLASPVYAADIRLSSSCSLADAIIAANNDRAEGNCPAGRGADTITLTRDITLNGGLPKITSDITIEGEGYTISGDNLYRMFYNDGGALTIKDLTMTKGRVEGDIITNNEDGRLKNITANPIGGAIVNLGELSISNSSFSDNLAEYYGGAIFNYWGELSISDSAFSGNSAEYGGAIYNAGDRKLSISNSIFNNNNSAEWGGAIVNAGELSISDSSFSGNSALAGGAILNGRELSITSSTFSDNSAEWSGGAIHNGKDGKLSITSSTFSDNSADWDGGAIYNVGELSISSSTFSDNSADEDGGAIYNSSNGTLSIINSSFSGNSAESDGGAIDNGGELSIINSTFSGNSADKGGTIFNGEDGNLHMRNSIIAGRGGACYSESRLRHNISNFIQDGSCSPSFQGDPMLGELVEPEDGSPAYFPLLDGSPAIDAADDGYCPATDQIGIARPQDAGCDIGAIEYAAP